MGGVVNLPIYAGEIQARQLGVVAYAFNEQGEAIGYVSIQPEQSPFLDGKNPMVTLTNPPKFFVPTKEFAVSFSDPVKAGEPLKLPWLGVAQLTGLQKDVAEYYGLKDKPAIQIGDVVPDSPASEAGLKQGMVIVELDGEPLERGDLPEELPQIMNRKLLVRKVGEKVTLGVISDRDQPIQKIVLTLGEQPKRANTAERAYFDDLGFTAREVLFADTYTRRLPKDHKGVVIAFLKPQSSAATALRLNDMVTEINGIKVESVQQLRTPTKSSGKTSQPKRSCSWSCARTRIRSSASNPPNNRGRIGFHRLYGLIDDEIRIVEEAIA